ncbi:MAG: DUF4350 domain-containing protein [Cyanobacteria bacterium P01_A01_bin.84]
MSASLSGDFSAMKSSNRLAWIVGITVLAALLLTIITAPAVNKINSGSTYSRSPSGYGAWYAYMEKQGTPIQRWQKPFTALMGQKTPLTLIRINSDLEFFRELNTLQEKFVKSGNTLVILGVREPVRTTQFSSIQTSKVGGIKVDTGRRKKLLNKQQLQLGDTFGAVVWEKKYGKGKAIFATTPDLAANAYQNNLSNYRYLADLVTKDKKSLFIDEYIHGYRDKLPQTNRPYSDSKESLLSYLSKTPLAIAFIQAGVLLLVLILAQNQRIGRAKSLQTLVIDNSEAYIQALATVLHKAESHNYVVETVAAYEERELRKALGIISISDNFHRNHTKINSAEEILSAWELQIGAVPPELKSVLKIHHKNNCSQKDLRDWLQSWQKVKQALLS